MYHIYIYIYTCRVCAITRCSLKHSPSCKPALNLVQHCQYSLHNHDRPGCPTSWTNRWKVGYVWPIYSQWHPLWIPKPKGSDIRNSTASHTSFYTLPRQHLRPTFPYLDLQRSIYSTWGCCFCRLSTSRKISRSRACAIEESCMDYACVCVCVCAR